MTIPMRNYCSISRRRLRNEKEYYNVLDRASLEKEDGFKIFVMHGAVTEYKPKYAAESESIPLLRVCQTIRLLCWRA